MKRTSMSSLVLLAALFIGMLPSTLSAQEWSAEQREIWKNVEAYWAADAAGKTDDFLSYFHTDYSGWSLDRALPATKGVAAKFITHGHGKTKTLLHDLQPVAIKIHGNIAVVHYYWTVISKTDDKEKETSGRWTDVLMKQGTKWVLVADHGGTPPKN